MRLQIMNGTEHGDAHRLQSALHPYGGDAVDVVYQLDVFLTTNFQYQSVVGRPVGYQPYELVPRGVGLHVEHALWVQLLLHVLTEEVVLVVVEEVVHIVLRRECVHYLRHIRPHTCV